MKKILCISLLVFSLAFNPQKSQGVTGITVATFPGFFGKFFGIPLALYSATFLIGGPYLTVSGVIGHDCDNSILKCTGKALYGLLLTSLGIMLLDDEDQKLKYGPIDDELRKQIGISSEEQLTFNNEIEEINTVLDEVLLNIKSINTENLTEEEIIEKLKSEWLFYKEQNYISQTSLNVLDKLDRYILNSLK